MLVVCVQVGKDSTTEGETESKKESVTEGDESTTTEQPTKEKKEGDAEGEGEAKEAGEGGEAAAAAAEGEGEGASTTEVNGKKPEGEETTEKAEQNGRKKPYINRLYVSRHQTKVS